MRRLLTLTTVLLLAASACKKDSTGPDGNNGNGNLANGSMSATINGSDWRATLSLAGTYSSGILAIAGTNGTSGTLGMALFASGTGTFPFTAANGGNATLTVGSSAWVASGVTGSGSVTITALSSTGATGTFTLSMVPSGAATGNKTVTNGAFNVKF